MPRLLAIRARRAFLPGGEAPARGAALFAPLLIRDNALLLCALPDTIPPEAIPPEAIPPTAATDAAHLMALCAHGHIAYAGPYAARHIPPHTPVYDLGDVCLAPGAVNAHCHLQLAHTAGRLRYGAGFAPWLETLVSLLREPFDPAGIDAGAAQLAAAGTAHVGDVTGAGAALVAQALHRHGVGATLLAEWFGFAPAHGGIPSVVSAALEGSFPAGFPPGDNTLRLAPAGHAPYSTAAATLVAAHAFCRAHNLPFSLHLAESPEEDQALLHGTGPLVAFYRARVLPPDWRAPGLAPVEYAAHLGLLAPGTLAVHCVQCAERDIALLARSGTAVCLCPRSNALLSVGTAPVRAMAAAGVLLCLGTDGLSSNEDLNVWQEAHTLARRGDLPGRALLRLLCVNGWAALGLAPLAALRPGERAHWAVVPESLCAAL